MKDPEKNEVEIKATDFKPFVPIESELPELTFKALALGIIMAIVLGAANAYVGMKAGLTVAATFPAAYQPLYFSCEAGSNRHPL